MTARHPLRGVRTTRSSSYRCPRSHQPGTGISQVKRLDRQLATAQDANRFAVALGDLNRDRVRSL